MLLRGSHSRWTALALALSLTGGCKGVAKILGKSADEGAEVAVRHSDELVGEAGSAVARHADDEGSLLGEALTTGAEEGVGAAAEAALEGDDTEAPVKLDRTREEQLARKAAGLSGSVPTPATFERADLEIMVDELGGMASGDVVEAVEQICGKPTQGAAANELYWDLRTEAGCVRLVVRLGKSKLAAPTVSLANLPDGSTCNPPPRDSK